MDGRSYENDRIQAGWISDKAYESGARDLAKSLSPGSQVSVRYDSHHPEFALLEYGWPKWSLGFSLAVWGMWFGSYVFESKDRRPKSHVLYGLTRGMWLLGFMIIILLPPTLKPEIFPTLLGTGLVLGVVAGVYSWLRFSQTV